MAKQALILYYSQFGNTARLASKIHEVTGADIVRIKVPDDTFPLDMEETNNITKAAEQLHITQPTLSRQIMDLETELDIKLFNREKRRLQLTKAGILFQQRATTMLQLLDQTENDLHQQEEALTGEINLGSAVSSVSPYITKLIFEFQKLYPNVIFNLSDGDGDGDVLRR